MHPTAKVCQELLHEVLPTNTTVQLSTPSPWAPHRTALQRQADRPQYHSKIRSYFVI